jgi:hypothetical protein
MKIITLQATADKRLEKYKQTKAKADELNDALNETKEKMTEELLDARTQIRQLKEELLRKTEEAEELQLMSDLAREDVDKFSFHKVKKIGNPKTWDPIVTQLVVETLAHPTPPACISANILSVVKLLMPNANVVEELPGLLFNQNCRTVLLYVTKTLAAYEIASVELYQQLFTDGTGQRQTEMQNIVIGILTESGYSRVALNGCVISEGTSEYVTAAIVATFRKSGKLLEKWRSVFEELYPDRQDLLEKIPQPSELTLAKLARDGFAMTDTCNTAQQIQHLIAEAVQDIAKEHGLLAEEIKLRESFCWQHLQNIWFGAVSGHSILPLVWRIYHLSTELIWI